MLKKRQTQRNDRTIRKKRKQPTRVKNVSNMYGQMYMGNVCTYDDQGLYAQKAKMSDHAVHRNIGIMMEHA